MSFLRNLINGISLGSVYAIIALGYTMVYGIAKMLNFAHGDVIMVGAYVVFVAMSNTMPAVPAVLLSIVICTGLGILIERIAYRPLRNASSPLAVLITAIGVSYLLQNLALLIFGSNPKSFASVVNVPDLKLAGGKLTITGETIVTIVASLVIVFALTAFINKTKPGQAMVAVSEDQGAAKLMGINVNGTIALTFAIGSSLAAIGAIAAEHGIRYLIDGAQAVGALPVDVRALRCDLYAFPGHKSLLGPQGTGGLYIRPGVDLLPLREGGTGSSSESLFQPRELPERYESGTVNLPGIAGLCEGCAYVSEHLSAIMMHERELTSALFEGLSALPGVTLYSPREEAARAGIVAFNAGGLSSTQVADALAGAGIAVRGGLHCAPEAHRFLGTLRRGAVRASVGWANTFEDIDALVAAVKALL